MIHRQRLLSFALTIIGSLSIISSSAQLNTEYFERLKSNKVTSTDKIEWVQFAPGTAGYCEEFWCHPTDPNTILIGPDMHVAYGTWDMGESWQGLKDVDGAGDETLRIIEVVFSRQDPDLVFYLDRDGNVRESNDRGRTWSIIYNVGSCLSELAIDPTDDNKLYIGAGDFFNIKDTHKTLLEPTGNMNRRSEYGYILKSVDQGRSWKKITEGLPTNADIGKILVNPNNTSEILALTGHGLYFSYDEGLSWSRGGDGLPHNLPRDISAYYDTESKKYILYLVEQTMFAADGESVTCKGGVFKSIDGGKSWIDITSNLSFNLKALDSPSSKNFYYKTISKWFSIDSNKARELYPELPEDILTVFNHISVNPLNPDEIYIAQNVKQDVGFSPVDVYKSDDGGKSWYGALRSGKYWLEGRDQEYWKERGNPVGANVKFGHLQPEIDRFETYQGNRFLVFDAAGDIHASIDQQMLKSTDGGATWFQIDDIEVGGEGSGLWSGRGCSDMPGRMILQDTGVEGRYLLCAGEHGLWQTVPDSGQDRVVIEQLEGQINHNGSHSISSVAVHPKDPNTIYTLQFRQSNRGYFCRSTDGGESWESISRPVIYDNPNTSSPSLFQYSLMVDPKNPKNIYFTLIAHVESEVATRKDRLKDFDDYGVYRSQDGGYSWELCNVGLPDRGSVNRLAMDTKSPKTIYAACNMAQGVEGGLYRTTDGCSTWEEVTIPSEIVSVNNVHIDKQGKIYICCGRKADTEYEGGIWVSDDNCKNWSKIFEMPYVWQIASSPIDPDILIVSSAGRSHDNEAGPHENGVILNAGIYISHDGGANWSKANRGLVQMDKMTDVCTDPTDPNMFWCAGWGSGWYRGIWSE